MGSFLRLATLSFLGTTSLVLVGAVAEAGLPSGAVLNVAQAARGSVYLDLSRSAVPSAPVRSRATAVHPEPEGPPGPVAPLFVAFEEPASLQRWAPPGWFPEQERDGLWALDGIDGDSDLRGPRLHSKAVFVYDVDSGEVLLNRNADDRRPVASLTKVVSALAMASESPDLDREVCLDLGNRPSWPGAGTRLKSDTCTSGWDLLGAALVRSDNGAAYSLPKVAGLPHYPFVRRMNQIAADLGMDMSDFSDPSGVEDDNLSTARDMTRATLAASMHPTLQPVIAAPFWDTEDRTHNRTRRLFTTNRLHERSRTEVLAAKTGYTDTARHCFTAVIRTRDGRTIAMTTLGARWSRQRWADARAVLAWVESGAKS